MVSHISETIHQGHLIAHIKNIFPNEETQENVHRALNLKYPDTGEYMEIDLWIPNKELCFEFQDPHHYVTTWYHHHNPDTVRSNDSFKQAAANQMGLSLIEIPCWWDGSKERLLGTLYFQRPDLADSSGHIDIGLNPPLDYFRSRLIPGVGELMYASFASDIFISSLENRSWWLGEKYDGIRFCYNPETQQSYTRHSSELELLPQIVDNMPTNMFLDGEIWFGRLQFSLVYTLLNESMAIPWQTFRMISFDLPSEHLHNNIFEERYKALLSSMPDDHPFNVIAARMLYNDNFQLNAMLANILATEGEGVMVRKANSLYEPGRSKALLKVKSMQGDGEAVVVGCSLTHLELKLPNGRLFQVPNEDATTSPFPKVGDIVTFSYSNFRHARKAIPDNPKIIRIRKDVAWEDVVQNENAVSDQIVPSRKEFAWGDRTTNERHKWKNIQTRRAFLEQYAINNGFDPHVPGHWYSHPKKTMLQQKRIKSVLSYHQQNISQMLIDLFPDIGLDRSKLESYQSAWSTAEMRRNFFEKFAEDRAFDPLVPDNWYKHRSRHISKTKGGAAVLLHHQYNLSKALIDLFPDIGLDSSKFRSSKKRKE